MNGLGVCIKALPVASGVAGAVRHSCGAYICRPQGQEMVEVQAISESPVDDAFGGVGWWWYMLALGNKVHPAQVGNLLLLLLFMYTGEHKSGCRPTY